MCQRSSRRITEKDRAAAGSPSQSEQMGRGDSTKVESAKRRRQECNKTRRKETEVHFASWRSSST